MHPSILNIRWCLRFIVSTAILFGAASAPQLSRGNEEIAETQSDSQSGAASLVFPGKHSEWNGFDRYDFEVDGKPVLVVAPKNPAVGRPWVWHGEFFGHKPAPDIALLKQGYHIVYMSVPNMLGAPKAVKHWNQCYDELTQNYGFARKVALVGLSRGGLYCYNWATANPDKVACIYADAAVCDFKSWPGGKGKGKGSPADWKLVLDQYGFASDEEAMAWKGNPVDSLAPLARAGVPLLHVYGDADDVVPWDENTGVVADRYKALGGSITLIAKPGVNHHPHGLEDSTPIVEFIALNCSKSIVEQQKETVKLRILSYNIHHAEGIDGKLDVERIAKVITSCQPDIVSIQEVDKKVERTKTVDQPNELAQLTGMHFVFGANIKLQSGHYGNVVLSKYPITQSQNHFLPCYENGEQRGVLEAVVALPNASSLTFLATHFDHRPHDSERQASAMAIRALLETSPHHPAILAGDLNATVNSATLNLLLKDWSKTSKEVQPTIPVSKPTQQIDFILFRPASRWKLIESRVLDESVASDHRPVFAILELLPTDSANP